MTNATEPDTDTDGDAESAASIRLPLFVLAVIGAAQTMDPSISNVAVRAGSDVYVGSASANRSLASERITRSCGRFGPASDGTTVDRSSSRYSE